MQTRPHLQMPFTPPTQSRLAAWLLPCRHTSPLLHTTRTRAVAAPLEQPATMPGLRLEVSRPA